MPGNTAWYYGASSAFTAHRHCWKSGASAHTKILARPNYESFSDAEMPFWGVCGVCVKTFLFVTDTKRLSDKKKKVEFYHTWAENQQFQVSISHALRHPVHFLINTFIICYCIESRSSSRRQWPSLATWHNPKHSVWKIAFLKHVVCL